MTQPQRPPDSSSDAWLSGPLTSPVCPQCGRKERPTIIEGEGTEHVVYECRRCNRRWTVRHQSPEGSGRVSTRRHG